MSNIKQDLKNGKLDKVEILYDLAKEYLDLEEIQELSDDLASYIHRKVIEEKLCPCCYTEMVYEGQVMQEHGEMLPKKLVCFSCGYNQDL